jgi:hypothetical protein
VIINLNGWPGVGKLSIALQLQKQIGGHLLDNHAIFNVAFSLCEFRSPDFFETVRRVREIAFARIANMPLDRLVILTSAYADTPFGRENWTAIRAMADLRRSKLYTVIVDCDLAENVRRIQTPERAVQKKLTEPEPLIASRAAHGLLESGGDFLLRVDASGLAPDDCARKIAVWLSDVAKC